jgi:ABC-type transporter Mla subunit MlaD
MSLISSRMQVELRRSRRSVVIMGIGILAMVLALAILISKENVHLPWENTYTVKVAVSNAEGVTPGLDEVRWAGIVVGRITDEKVTDGQIVLTAQMNANDLGGARLYKNARVDLRPATPLNDEYLDVVSRGSKSAGALSDGILAADQVETPVNFSDVLDTFSEPVRQDLQALLDQLGTGLSKNGGEQLQQAYGQIAPLLIAQKELSDDVVERSNLVKQLVHDSGAVFTALNERNTELDTLVRNGAGTLGALGDQSQALGQLIAELPGTLSQIHSSFGQLQTTLGVVRPALVDLLPTAKQLPTGLKSLRQFSTAAGPALTALNPAISALEPLARNLPGTAVALKSTFNQLEPQAPQLNNITAAIVPCELYTDKFFAYTISTLKFNNAGNLTASPRGILTLGTFETGGKDPNLSPTTGCADGNLAPTTPDTQGQVAGQ